MQAINYILQEIRNLTGGTEKRRKKSDKWNVHIWKVRWSKVNQLSTFDTNPAAARYDQIHILKFLKLRIMYTHTYC